MRRGGEAKGGRTESRDASSLVVYAEVKKNSSRPECYNGAAADGWSYT